MNREDEIKDEILEKISKNRITRKDKFKFVCNQCGKCCKNRRDILLNPYDLNRLAHALKMSPQDIVDKYCSVFIGQDSRFPCVCLEPIGEEEICPLLDQSTLRCSVHKEKPTVCALYPLARGMEVSENKSVFYFFQDVECGLRDEEHTVEEWLKEFNLTESEEWFAEWGDFLGKTVPVIKEIEERHYSKKVMEMLYNTILIATYFNYEQDANTEYFEYKSFINQFRITSKKLSDLLYSVKTGIGIFKRP